MSYPSPAEKRENNDVRIGVFLGLCLVIFILMMVYVYAITSGCGNEVDINTACVIRTPPITCSTYDLFNSTNNLTIDDGTMEEVYAGTGVYNFTFLPNASGIHTIVLCDNTSTQINVETTDETDLGTILSNQATLQNNIETVNQTVKDQAAAVNASIRLNVSAEADKIIENLSNDLGFFNPLLQIFNLSIIDHIRNNITAAVTDIVSRGDSAWITATGFQTETNAATRYGNLLLNFSDVLNNATDILADTDDIQSNQNWDVWDDGTRTLTTADWQTESNALTRFTSLSDGIQKNATLALTTIGNINTSIIANLSNDNGFFRPLFFMLNTSLILNLSNPPTVSISTADEENLALAFAKKVLGANLTTYYNYNTSAFTLTNVVYNYSNLGIVPNETYTYDNESFLNVTDRVTK